LPDDEQAALDLLKNRQIQVDEHGMLQPIETEHRDFLGDNERPILETTPAEPEPEENPAGAPFDLSKFALTPPTMGGTLTANSRPEGFEPSTDPLTVDKTKPQILSHERPGANKPESDQKQVEPDTDSAQKAEFAAAPEASKPTPESKPPEAARESEPQPKLEPAASEEPTPPVVPDAAPEPLIAPAFPMPTEAAAPAQSPKTLEDLEKEVHSAHLAAQHDDPAPSAPEAPAPLAAGSFPAPVDLAPPTSEAHPALQAALQETQNMPAPSTTPEPVSEPVGTPGGSLQAQPLTAAEMATAAPVAPEPAAIALPTDPNTPPPELQAQTMDMPLPSAINMPAPNMTPTTSSPTPNASTAPPVPPPFMPPINT
jgi:hypothetical protein